MTAPNLLCSPMPCGPNLNRARVSFEADGPVEAYVAYGETESSLLFKTSVEQALSAPYVLDLWVPEGLLPLFDLGGGVWYQVNYRTPGDPDWTQTTTGHFWLARPEWDLGPWVFTFGAGSFGSSGETTSATFKSDFLANLLPFYSPGGTEVQAGFHVQIGDVLAAEATPEGYYQAARGDQEGFGRDTRCLRMPVVLCLGDREVDTLTGMADSRRLRWPVGGFADLQGVQTDLADPEWKERYCHWRWGNALFVVLDDQTYGVHGNWRMSPAQRVWLAQTLEANKDATWKFVFAHTPLWEADPAHGSGSLANLQDNRTWLLRQLHGQGVTAFLHGRYGGWSTYVDSAGMLHCCSNFGGTLDSSGSTASIAWHGEGLFGRFVVGWDSALNVPNEGRASLELADPTDGSVLHHMELPARLPAGDVETPDVQEATLNHGGGSFENPVFAGIPIRVVAAKDAGVSPRKCWVTAPGRAGPIVSVLTGRLSVTESSVTVDVMTGTDLQPSDAATLNVVHLTLDDDSEAVAGIWCATPPITGITLDGYDGGDPATPIVEVIP